MCGIIVVEVLSVVIRESRMILADLTDSEVSIEWTRTGTMIEFLGILTCGTPLAYLRDPMPVIANGEYGIARDGQNRRGMIPTMAILSIDRAVLPLTLMDTVGTRTTTTGFPGGRTKIVTGIRVDLGQIGSDDLLSVILLLLLEQQASGRLGRSAKRGNNGSVMQGGGRHTLRPCLVQIAGMTREHL